MKQMIVPYYRELSYAAGFLYSVLGSFILVRLVVNKMWKKMGWSGQDMGDEIRPFAWSGTAVGCVESALYTASILNGKPEFIAIWLTLKLTAQWKRWSEEHGRSIYNVFLTGNGLSIGYGVMGAWIIIWLQQKDWRATIIASLSLIIATLFFWGWASRRQQGDLRKPRKEVKSDKLCGT